LLFKDVKGKKVRIPVTEDIKRFFPAIAKKKVK